MKNWKEDIATWIASLRFSFFTVLVVAIAIVGTLVLSPKVSTFVQQQREIAQLRENIRQYREAVDQIDAERAQWKDPAYVRAQARDRLSYVLPGETQLTIIEDVVLPAESDEETRAGLTQVQRNWAKDLAASVIASGNAIPEPPTENDAARSEE